MATKELPSPELLRKLLRYEPETGKLFWRKRPSEMFAAECRAKSWNTRFADREAFSSDDGEGYRVGAILDATHRSHRVIWAMVHDEWPAEQIDHINGDPSDNRIDNLRAVSCAENQRNRRLSANNTSGVVGVDWYGATGKWRAKIKVNRRTITLGYFNDFEGAAGARKAAEAKHSFHKNHGL